MGADDHAGQHADDAADVQVEGAADEAQVLGVAPVEVRAVDEPGENGDGHRGEAAAGHESLGLRGGHGTIATRTQNQVVNGDDARPLRDLGDRVANGADPRGPRLLLACVPRPELRADGEVHGAAFDGSRGILLLAEPHQDAQRAHVAVLLVRVAVRREEVALAVDEHVVQLRREVVRVRARQQQDLARELADGARKLAPIDAALGRRDRERAPNMRVDDRLLALAERRERRVREEIVDAGHKSF